MDWLIGRGQAHFFEPLDFLEVRYVERNGTIIAKKYANQEALEE